ncbi:YolD-like family protein [Lentibacillus sp. Marseille-P4043]|uniref:YolD-like family protein n=1 Tax=Lentibacillus sp. Marseille-P4043 TaxID=2040293 RepID=UPI00131A5C42|nr:YolD-like family protein [Lentibacillus sp. Marseille-P4043]
MNKLTPGSNMMWESSRMMLPEHKARIRQHQKEMMKKTKPILDDQQKLEIGYKIQCALHNDLTVEIKYFSDGDYLTVKDKLQMIDTRKIRLREGKEVAFDDVLDVYVD